MSLTPRSPRTASLREQAQRALQNMDAASPDASLQSMDLPRLLEELRIYHEELEIQNDELQIAQTRSEAARSRYQLLFGLLPLPALLVDKFGAIQEDNDASQDWLGPARIYQPSDLRLNQALAKADRPRLTRLLVSLDPTRKGVLAGLTITGFDRRDRLIDLHVARLPQDFHQDARFLVVLLDRSAEAARQAEQTLFNALLDCTDDLIYATDVHGRVMLANQPFTGALGLGRDRILGRKITDFWPLKNMAQLQTVEADVRTRMQPMNHTQEVQWLPGQAPMCLAIRSFPLKNRLGEAMGVASVCRDITAEHGRGQNRYLAELGFMGLPVPVVLTDAQDRIQLCNPLFQQATGFTATSMQGLTLHMLMQAPPLPGACTTAAEVWSHLVEHRQWQGPRVLRQADGALCAWNVTASRVQTAANDPAMVVWLFMPRQHTPDPGPDTNSAG